MKKVILQLDSSNTVLSLDGMHIGILQGEAEEYKSSVLTVDELIALREAGYTNEELLELHKRGII